MIIKDILDAIEIGMLADESFEFLHRQITCAVNGLMPPGWTNNGVVLVPSKQTPQQYPASISNHTEIGIIVHCYSEFFGERTGLMGNDYFTGILDLERIVLDFLVPDGNADFNAFDGLVSACFWTGTIYPELNRRTYPGWNEARVSFSFRN